MPGQYQYQPIHTEEIKIRTTISVQQQQQKSRASRVGRHWKEVSKGFELVVCFFFITLSLPQIQCYNSSCTVHMNSPKEMFPRESWKEHWSWFHVLFLLGCITSFFFTTPFFFLISTMPFHFSFYSDPASAVLTFRCSSKICHWFPCNPYTKWTIC